MITFILERTEDHTGVSGTGIVAEGVIAADGAVALRWIVGGNHSWAIHDSIKSVEAIHGHGGSTKIVYPPTSEGHQCDIVTVRGPDGEVIGASAQNLEGATALLLVAAHG